VAGFADLGVVPVRHALDHFMNTCEACSFDDFFDLGIPEARNIVCDGPRK
jgi:hypothetical protein